MFKNTIEGSMKTIADSLAKIGVIGPLLREGRVNLEDLSGSDDEIIGNDEINPQVKEFIGILRETGTSARELMQNAWNVIEDYNNTGGENLRRG